MITIYSRANCHLCDEAKAIIESTLRAARLSVPIEVIDIDADPELRARYDHEVPVVFVRGKKAFKYRVDPKELLRRLQAG